LGKPPLRRGRNLKEETMDRREEIQKRLGEIEGEQRDLLSELSTLGPGGGEAPVETLPPKNPTPAPSEGPYKAPVVLAKDYPSTASRQRPKKEALKEKKGKKKGKR
jgi:hypothetical protein